MFTGDRSADMDAYPGKGSEFLILQKFSYLVAGGLIENESVGPFPGTVFSQKNHGVVEGALPQGGIGEEKLTLELDG